MSCTKCGAPLNGAAFCASCGTPANSSVNVPIDVTPNQPTSSGYQVPPSGLGFPTAARTNGLAITSLVVSIAGSMCGLGFLGLIFGLIALNQIKKSNGTQAGNGLALAGTIIGGLTVLLYVYLIFAIAATSRF